MCARAKIASNSGVRSARRPEDSGRRSSSPNFPEERTSPKARIASALSVLAPVALSGVFLVVFVPQLWWIFTTYFWIAFPALGSLRQGLVDAIEERPPRASKKDVERELLIALRRHGEMTSGLAAVETSLPVAEVDGRLGELARDGHLEVRARGGAIFYALWDSEPREKRLQPGREDPS